MDTPTHLCTHGGGDYIRSSEVVDDMNLKINGIIWQFSAHDLIINDVVWHEINVH